MKKPDFSCSVMYNKNLSQKTFFCYPNSIRKFNKSKDINVPKSKEVIFLTLDFIEKLEKELQQFPAQLKTIFPKRKVSYSYLSVLWGLLSSKTGEINKDYVRSNVGYEKTLLKQNRYYKVSENKLDLLKSNLSKKFGITKLKKILKIIEKYKNNLISFTQFAGELCDELSKISKHIEVTDRELSVIMGYTKERIKNIKYEKGNNYKFSLEVLDQTIKNLSNLLSEKADNAIKIIQDYIKKNSDLKLYSKQQVTITNPAAFDIKNLISKLEAFFFFGLLCADGHVRKHYLSKKNSYMIKLKLKWKDREIVKAFADFVGYDKSRIGERYEISNNKIIKFAVVQFHSKQMCNDLKKLKHFSSGDKEINKVVPPIIKFLIKLASEKYDLICNYCLRCALCWLLGYFDGDGHKDVGFNARIYSSSRSFLFGVKKQYGIKNEISTRRKGKDNQLTLGTELYKEMLFSYPYSLKRKRHQEFDRLNFHKILEKYRNSQEWIKRNEILIQKLLYKFKSIYK